MTGHDDFANIWAGPRALLAGADPYDAATWSATAVGLGTGAPDSSVYLYPPWVALALVPIGALPLAPATAVWTGTGVLLALVALRAWLHRAFPTDPYAHALGPAALLLSGPGISTLLTGQWTFFLVAGMSAVLLLIERRPLGAGTLSATMLAKPQLFLFAAPALALGAVARWTGRSERRAGLRYVAAAVATGILVVAVAHVAVPTWWPAWPQSVTTAHLLPESAVAPGLISHAFGASGWLLIPATIAALVAAGLRFDPASAAWIPLWLAISIALAPYSNAYDLLLLIVPVLAASAALAGRSPSRAAALYYAGMATLVAVATALHALDRLAYALVVPVLVCAVIAVAAWPIRRAPEARPV